MLGDFAATTHQILRRNTEHAFNRNGTRFLRKMLQQRALERCVGELVNPQRPKKRILSDAINQIVFANEDAALGAAQQFVSAGCNKIHTTLKGLKQAGFSTDAKALKRGHKPGALIFKQRNAHTF